MTRRSRLNPGATTADVLTPLVDNTITRDATGRVVSETAVGVTTTYTRGATGRITTITRGTVSKTVTRDSTGRIIGVA